MTYASFCFYPKNNKSISDWADSFAKRIVLFFKVGVSRVIHFLRGLNLEMLNLSFGTYIIEIEEPDKTIFFKEKFIYKK